MNHNHQSFAGSRWANLVKSVHRLPFTAGLILTVLIVTASNGLWDQPLGQSQLTRWGFGLQDLVHLEVGVTKMGSLFALTFLVLLVAWKEDFRASSRPYTSRVALRGLAAGLFLVPVISWLLVLAIPSQFVDLPGSFAVAGDVVRRIFFFNPAALVPANHWAEWLLQAIPLAFWSVNLTVIVRFLRSATAPQPAPDDVDRARSLALVHGRTITSYMGTASGNSIFFGADRHSFVAYRVSGNIAVALGDPTGAPESLTRTAQEFRDYCLGRGWSPVILAATEALRAAYEQLDFHLLQIGKSSLVPLKGLEFRGKAWQNLRSAFNRAEKSGVTFILAEGGRLNKNLEAQVFEISRQWGRQQKLPPMEFTLGKTEDVRDPNIEVALAVDAAGRVQGFVDWLPIPAGRGHVIDLMRRRPGAMNGTMEYLIGMSMLAFQQRGDDFISLAAAPLADLDRSQDSSLLPQVLEIVSRRFENFCSFQSLFDFKDRFQPRWESVYFAYLDPTELPEAALAVVKVHMPDLSLADGVKLFGKVLAGQVWSRDREPAAPPPAPST